MARPRQRAWSKHAARAGTLAVAATALLGLVWLAGTDDLARSDKLAVVGIAVGLAGALLAIPGCHP